MTGLSVRAFVEADRGALIDLWERCGLTRPWNDPSLDIDRKHAHDADGLIVVEGAGDLVGAVMAGYDGHRGWINYLAVSPDAQGRGCGRVLMNAAEAYLLGLGCAKVNLQIRTSNLDAVTFYDAIGYLQDDVISYGRRLIDDAPEA